MLFGVALVIALLTKSFVVQPFYIPSASMEDTLLIGDKVLVNKLVYRVRPISRGDVVVFNGTGSWDPQARPPRTSHNPLARMAVATVGWLVSEIEGLFGDIHGQTDYIKRVIGVPGDHVACCNARGQITVNGVALHEKAFLIPGGAGHRRAPSASSCRPAGCGSWATTGRIPRTPGCTTAPTPRRISASRGTGTARSARTT